MAIPLGFLPKPLSVELDKLLPCRRLPSSVEESRKYKQIRASIEEIGLIEPLCIAPIDKVGQTHMLLDGHIRLMILRDLGQSVAPCLVATDDESYTYNNRLNRLSTIQEHLMLKRAIEKGVAPEKLAKAFNLDSSYIRKQLGLLNGICPEAADLMRDRVFSKNLTVVLRKMKPTRQVECVELMVSSNNFAVPYLQAMLEVTPADLLVNPTQRKALRGVNRDQMLIMDREMQAIQNQSKLLEENYGSDILHLVLAQKYLGKLLANQQVERYLGLHQPDILEQLRSIAEASTAEQ
jgi:RepB plasmid partitioning protein